MRTIDGIEVINATSDFQFEIKPDHILKGIPLDKERCAGAIACAEAIPNCVRAKFYKSRIFVLQQINNTNELIWIRYSTTKKMLVLEAINDVSVKSMEQAQKYAGVFVLKAPTNHDKATGRQQGTDKNPEAPKTKRVLSPIPMRDNAPTRDT